MRLIACLIARDEEKNLPRCLESLRGVVDGICLVDTGSKDRTVEIARSFGATVGSQPWEDDFSKARNAVLDLAEGDWALQIDADEEFDPSTLPALRQALESASICHLVEVELRDGSSRPGSVLLPRLHRLDSRVRYRRALHESVLDSLRDAGFHDPAPVPVRLVHHGYAPDELSARSKRERNLRILRKVRDAGTADAYDLYKLATTLPPWEPTPERSRSLEQAWTAFLVQARDQRDSYPWWPTLARAYALDLARQGRFGTAWAILETPGPAGRSIASTRAEILLRAGRYGEALDQARRACEIEPDSGLSARDGKETARMWHLAARCARAAGGDPTPALERAVLEGSLEARCDLALDKIRQKDPSGWKDLDLVLRAHSAHPVVLLAASEAARWQGDRSTSDLLLAQAAKTPSEAGERAQARQWMRAWLEGNRPAFELPPSEIENVAAQGIDRIRSGREWRPDPFLDPRVLRSCLADILEALLHAGHEEAIRSFARNAVGRDGDFPGLSTLVEGS